MHARTASKTRLPAVPAEEMEAFLLELKKKKLKKVARPSSGLSSSSMSMSQSISQESGHSFIDLTQDDISPNSSQQQQQPLNDWRSRLKRRMDADGLTDRELCQTFSLGVRD